MADSWYTKARQSIGQAEINLLTDDIRVLLATAGYSPNLATDQYVSAIGSGNIAARSSTLASRAFSGIYLTAANPTLSLVPAGAACPYIIIFKWTGSDSTSPLLVKIDQGNNLPVTPTGGDITIQWNASGVCEI